MAIIDVGSVLIYRHVVSNPGGHIEVDDQLKTGVPGVWALGDCNGRGALTHTAYNDFEIVAANLLDGEDRRVSSREKGYALFIDLILAARATTGSDAPFFQPLLAQARCRARIKLAVANTG